MKLPRRLLHAVDEQRDDAPGQYGGGEVEADGAHVNPQRVGRRVEQRRHVARPTPRLYSGPGI
jgi:hypothetical protein